MKTHCPNCAVELKFPEISEDAISCPSCGSQIVLSRDFADAPTEVIEKEILAERFQIYGQLGKGRFGTVYKALDLTLKRFVAIKIPHAGSLSSRQTELVTNEARSTAQLNHPNIVAIYEVLRVGDHPASESDSRSGSKPSGSKRSSSPSKPATNSDETQAESSPSNPQQPLSSSTNSLCIISECIDGVSLKDCIGQYRGEYRRAAELCSKIARAMQHAHQRNVIHRDLKPANILIDAQEEPHIADFGLARLDRTVDESDDETVSRFVMGLNGEVLGTPAYMSPQQALGLSDRVDGRTDVYSLGIVLFEMLSGKRPFESGSRALLQQVVHEDLPDPRKLDQQIPADLANICLKAAEKNPEDRYKTASLMAEDLDRFLRGDPIEAKPWPWHRKTRRAVMKHKLSLAIATSLLLLAALLTTPLWPTRPEWWDTAPVISIDTTDHTPDATFLFVKVNELTWIPEEPPLVLGPFKAPVQERMPPGLYRVVATSPDGRFHEVLRTVPGPDHGLPNLARHLFFEVQKDGSFKLSPIQLFQNSEVINEDMVRLKGSEFKTDLGQGIEKSYFIPDFYVGRREVTFGQLKRYQVEIPPGYRIPPEIKDEDPVVGLTQDWAIEIAENMGHQLCNELLWEYTFEASSKTINGPIGLSELPQEVTSSDRNGPIRRVGPIGEGRRMGPLPAGVNQVGFRTFRPMRPATNLSETMRITFPQTELKPAQNVVTASQVTDQVAK